MPRGFFKNPPKRKNPVPEWLWDIKVGDVLLYGRRRKPRVVRSVHIYPPGRPSAGRSSVTFAISRCSWTKRCYTVVNFNDLLMAGIERPPVRIKAKMNTPIDARIERALQYVHRFDQKIGCCDVHGVA